MFVLDFVNWLVKRLLDPAAIIWLFLIVLSVLLLVRKRPRWALAVFSAVVFLTVFGGTGVSTFLIATLERGYYSENPLDVQEADAVFVLGGFVDDGKGEVHGFDATGSLDRLLAGMELVRAGKADVLLIGGGSAGLWSGSPSEYSVIRHWLDRWDISITVEHIGLKGADTYKELKALKALMKERGWQSVILVTSASHMRRVEAVCQSLGINEVILAACDFQSLPPHPWYLIPDMKHLYMLECYLYEQSGWFGYRLRGRIDI